MDALLITADLPILRALLTRRLALHLAAVHGEQLDGRVLTTLSASARLMARQPLITLQHRAAYYVDDWETANCSGAARYEALAFGAVRRSSRQLLKGIFAGAGCSSGHV